MLTFINGGVKLLANIVIIAKILIGFKVTGNMKKRLLTLLFAFATVCGFAQEKILDNI